MSRNGSDPKKPTCVCSMFKAQGICWHTGYKPTFHEPPEPEPEVPLAVKRMHQWVHETKDVRWPS